MGLVQFHVAGILHPSVAIYNPFDLVAGITIAGVGHRVNTAGLGHGNALFPMITSLRSVPMAGLLNIVHEDPEFVVVDKPSGMLACRERPGKRRLRHVTSATAVFGSILIRHTAWIWTLQV